MESLGHYVVPHLTVAHERHGITLVGMRLHAGWPHAELLPHATRHVVTAIPNLSQICKFNT